jgi:integrase
VPEAHYRLFRRASGMYYQQDTTTSVQVSLRTKDRHAAQEKLRAANESLVQPQLNLDLARIYLRAHDSAVCQRTWVEVMTAYSGRGRDSSRERCRRAFAGRDFDPIRDLLLINTKAENLLRVLATGKASVNHYLRRLVHHAEDLNWLPWTVMAKAAWPKVGKQPKRAITAEEHQRILNAEEKNPERGAFYQMLWISGGSQGDIARLTSENIDTEVLAYQRGKLREDAPPSCQRVGSAMRQLLETLPKRGYLFPRIAQQKSKDRAAEFCRRCSLLGVEGISLHSYRYAWAERAAQAGYPQRFAQAALGHASPAVHAGYHRRAVITVPSLDEYESANVIAFPSLAGTRTEGHANAG